MLIRNIVLKEITDASDYPKDPEAENELARTLAHIKNGGRVFELEWDGVNDPEGVEIADYKIWSTQLGYLDADKIGSPPGQGLRTIGQYDRLKVSGRPNHHRMIIHLCNNI